MEHFKTIEKIRGCDVGWHSSNIHPINREGCVGAAGIDKSYTLNMIMKLAYNMDDRPNIIIKAGKNAKWYMKKVPVNKIMERVEKQKWRDTSRCIMYIIVWE